MRLTYHDLCIRNAEAEDCVQLAQWWNDGKVMAHAGFPNGLGTTAGEIRGQIKDNCDDTSRLLIIEYKGSAIGEMSYSDQGNHTVEIGIKICSAEHQEKGLGRTVLSMLIGELFSMGFTKVILDTNLTNTRAQHVYEKLGFQKVGVRENSWKNQLGELQSSVDYELTSEHFVDWTEKRDSRS